MQLSNGGVIKVDGHLVRFTGDGQWMVSRFETVLGYVDTLAEVAGLIERHRERIRARLALVNRKAQERKEEAFAHATGFSVGMIRAHNIVEADGLSIDDMPEEIRVATKKDTPTMRTLSDAEFLSKVENILP